MKPIDYVYYLFDNGYNYKSFYRLNVWSGILECYFDKNNWSVSDERLDKLLEYGNGKRSLEQLIDWSFLTEEEVEEELGIHYIPIKVMEELIR